MISKIIDRLDQSNIFKKIDERKISAMLVKSVIIDIVKQAEKDYNNGWIKCSDGLPHEVLDMQDFKQIKVLVCTKNNLIKTCLYRWKKDYDGNYVGWEFSVYGVLAWQPLPEPYKEAYRDNEV